MGLRASTNGYPLLEEELLDDELLEDELLEELLDELLDEEELLDEDFPDELLDELLEELLEDAAGGLFCPSQAVRLNKLNKHRAGKYSRRVQFIMGSLR